MASIGHCHCNHLIDAVQFILGKYGVLEKHIAIATMTSGHH
jgi:hypothetical protein